MRSLIVIILVHLSSYCKAQLYNDSSMKSSLLEASRLLYGKGKPKNEKRALELLEECAGKGSGRAMDEIGLIYKKGLGVKPNQETAAAWFTKATATGYTLAWYHLGALYKEDASMKPDFSKIYNYFSKGKSLGDEQCMYALAYMHYKGLGCSQDYILAANLFSQGAFAGRPNSMYFYALCLRNGYGVPQNEDSAKFWLLKAAKKGYGMAIRELSNSAGENSNTKAKILAGKLKDVFDPEGNYHNRYRKVEHNISKNQLSGEYSGYIIKYDWSGQFAIGTSKVVLNLVYTDGKYKGTWLENDTLSIPVKASLTPHALVFEKTAYRRKDYYSPKKAIAYEFDQARLQWMQNKDSIYLAGNVYMFSPERNEPEKPLFLSLHKVIPSNATPQTINPLVDIKSANSGSEIRAYPNPFTNTITIDFYLSAKGEVYTQLLTVDGKVVYNNNGGIMDAGYYTLPIKVKDLPAGTYILKLQCGRETKTVKVVKQ